MGIIISGLELIGSMGLLLYSMRVMSDGIQKGAGHTMRKLLALMTGNRFLALLTGLAVTMFVQSSGATTVMTVSFVNAGILTLPQSIGVIFGANIGTTVTAWIVALFGFEFSISAFAVPVFGVGFFLSITKNKAKNAGEPLMGFGLLFLALGFLSGAIKGIDADNLAFLKAFSGAGITTLLVGIFAGFAVTALLHSSSAFTAVILTMASQGLVSWELAAATVLGSNIGSTVDAVLASLGTKVNARRVACVHVLFNIAGTLLAALFFRPFLDFVDFIIPGPVQDSLTIHIAMLHTIFNVMASVIFLPFVNQIAHAVSWLVKPNKKDQTEDYKLEFATSIVRENAEFQMVRVEKEIHDMFSIADRMFTRVKAKIVNKHPDFNPDEMGALSADENLVDQMREEITRFLRHCNDLAITDRSKADIPHLLSIVENIESMTDECYSIAKVLTKTIERNLTFQAEDIEKLEPYTELVQNTLDFIGAHISGHLTPEQIVQAEERENAIDDFKKNLAHIAQKRLESGADVKTELLYIDLVRHIERIGDRAFGVSGELAKLS
ncbi:MAG: Na/Pi cotransporter family protein [Treponemataceae bacterium]|nr:MAG: Na/Pi cotransporter family protein [Treponemataceae bacterium]